LVTAPDAAPGGLTRASSARPARIRAERLSALENMAWAIAHDLNNNLAIIGGIADVLIDETRSAPTSEHIFNYVQVIRNASVDATRIIARLRAFFRPRDDPKDFGYVDLASLVRDCVAELHLAANPVDRASSTIGLTLDLAPIQPIRGNRQDLHQAVTELLTNAIEATATDGKIDVRLLDRDGEIQLFVRDNGVGMGEDLVERCHEPFVTTQGVSGRGLGLSIVFGTLRRHGRRLELQSRPGRGTIVTAVLSAARKSPWVDRAQAPCKPERSLRVLIVDDNRSLLTVIAAMLHSDGHVVDAARDGSEALARCRAGHYDVVLTDQSMPQLTGLQLAAEIKAAAPNQPVVIMTGYDPEDAGDGLGAAVDAIVQKPVTLAALQRALAHAMAHS
jgi:CheY-like chemotaxis protein/anti-sigma regulatory factor (Ser/Thr protein kinase)